MSGTSSRPTSTPTEVTTSVRRWRPSATSAGERMRRPWRISIQAQTALIAVGQGVDGKAQKRRIDGFRREEAEIGFAQDRQRRDDDEHALEDGGKILHLVVAVRVVGIRRRGAEADGQEGRDRRHHVDDALQRVRIERDAARDVIGGIFQGENDRSDEDAADGKFLNPAPWHAYDMRVGGRNEATL